MTNPAIDDVVHFISAKHDNGGNWTACGKEFVYPLRGNGWRVRDISCPDCDKAICDMVHDNFRAMIAAAKGEV
jgi:hypothetical protein